MPSWTWLWVKPRHRAERSSQKPGVRETLETLGHRVQPWGGAALRARPPGWVLKLGCPRCGTSWLLGTPLVASIGLSTQNHAECTPLELWGSML
eukprot:15481294-Alexandrium_andersonii.AAC.1